MTVFNILVLSDLHLHHGDNEAGKPSYLSSKPALQSPARNPLTGIPDLLAQANIAPQWIVCPGDLGDGCDELAQSHAWQALTQLKRKTRARRLIGTTGNHDVESRRNNSETRPNDFLLALTPTFPTSPRSVSDRYWRDNFVYVEECTADINLLIVNSCAFHGVVAGPGCEEEFRRGRISSETIDRISETIRPKMKRRNLLLVHHHIRQHPWLPGETSHMVNGPALLEVLRNTGAQWLVIHGHQHLPNLSYAEGGEVSPIVFSAGSVAAQTTTVRGKRARNQLYCIQFDLTAPNNSALQGRMICWDWTPHVGWQMASRDSGLPHSCGFGYRGPLTDLASKIVNHVQQSNHNHIRWSEIVAKFPEVSCLIPEDVETLIECLQKQEAVVDYDRWGVPSAIGTKEVA
jgi:3',5'-cyclic AMP phosphodiesterase CpdA